MSKIKIKIIQETKVVSEKMVMGGLTTFGGNLHINQLRKDGIERSVTVERGLLRVLGYDYRIGKHLIGWGCHSVKPSDFKKVLKDLKSGVRSKIQLQGECDIKLTSFAKVVRIMNRRRTVPKEELIEKMEILLKIWEFLYSNKKIKINEA